MEQRLVLRLRRVRLVQTQTMAVCGRFFTLAVNEHGDLFCGVNLGLSASVHNP